jgi:hypothetical protein
LCPPKNKSQCFFFTIAHASSNRQVQERFQHSGETVLRHFHALVLEAMDQLIPHYIKLTDPNTIPTAITSNSKFYNFFNNCIVALDGTHIAAKVPEAHVAAFWNRTGYLSQNVLACCELDSLLFTYVLAGALLMMGLYLAVLLMQGLKSLLENTVLHHGCLLPSTEGYDTICVNGVKVIYGISIAPLMFHTNFSPKNPKELFNLRHSSLRNAVERIFGVLKKRFKVLTYQLEYPGPFKTQV